MNNFFSNISKDWSWRKTIAAMQTLWKICKKFSMLTQVLKKLGKFIFQQLTEDLVQKIILNIDSFKATPVGRQVIPANKLKCIFDIYYSFITKIINLFCENNYFPDDLKLEISPVFKKNDYISCVKGLWKDGVQSHLKFHERQFINLWLVLESIIAHRIAWCLWKYWCLWNYQGLLSDWAITYWLPS